ncbi:MAG: ribonuclease D [Rudaea sp.]|uniref:ribonuclease D n=1 Tax=unclassified Rudaea TaxID=2627037 RepID=UPI0010F692FB|nr:MULTISPECIES: ribonuclease D [unclassified Rudaea]MBN8884808.1 ribonuclease D [Rudaea sp.]
MHQWIDSTAALGAWMGKHAAATVVALDTEFMRVSTFAPILALVQVKIGDEVALLDSPQLGEHAALAASLADPSHVCVMHSASEDLEALAGIVPAGPAVLFDTQIAAAMAGLGFGLSYQKLVAHLFGVELPKSETRSDWLQRPLSAAQLDYAAQDVVWLPQIHARLADTLESLGRSAWLAEDCRRMIERVRTAAPDSQPQRAFRSAAEWPRENQILLRRLLRWRESAARRYDKPRSWLLDDAHALDLAQRPPLDANALFERTKGLRALRSAQRTEVLERLQAPADADDDATVAVPPPMNSNEKRAVAAMKDAVAAVAQELDLPEGLLCPRRHLEAFITDRAWPAALEGWRKPLLFERLQALCP